MYKLTFTTIAIIMLISSTPAQAQKPGFGDTFGIRIGAIRSKADANFSFTPDGLPETELDLSDLGLGDDATSVWVSVDWQFAQRWRLAGYFSSFDSSGSSTIEESGSWGDVDFDIGATLKTDFDAEIYVVDITWDFIQTENAHLGVGAGLHIADLSASLAATIQGSVNGQPGIIDLGRDRSEVTAPLPNGSIAGGRMFGENFYLTANAGYFSLTYDKFNGQLLAARGELEWRPKERFGAGVGYQYVKLNLEVDDSDFKEEYDISFHGPFVFLSLGL